MEGTPLHPGNTVVAVALQLGGLLAVAAVLASIADRARIRNNLRPVLPDLDNAVALIRPVDVENNRVPDAKSECDVAGHSGTAGVQLVEVC